MSSTARSRGKRASEAEEIGPWNPCFTILSSVRVNAWIFLILVYALAFVTARHVYWEVMGGNVRWLAWMGASSKMPLETSRFYAIFAGDVAATIVVWVFSLLVNNSSVYDPYWSLAPPFILLAHVTDLMALTAREFIVIVVVCLWAIRLTGNWAYGWREHEDWRYVLYRTIDIPGYGTVPTPVYWVVFSFGGFHLFPTILVWMGCWPFHAIFNPGTPAEAPLNMIDLFAFVVSIGCIALCFYSDREMWRYRARKAADPSRVPTFMSTGWWARSRHPNYFGEVGFWYGIAFFACAAWIEKTQTCLGNFGFLIAGALVITGLFVFISVPILDDKMRPRKGWDAYEKLVPSALLPVMFFEQH